LSSVELLEPLIFDYQSSMSRALYDYDLALPLTPSYLDILSTRIHMRITSALTDGMNMAVIAPSSISFDLFKSHPKTVESALLIRKYADLT
jgi:hypothetical protein